MRGPLALFGRLGANLRRVGRLAVGVLAMPRSGFWIVLRLDPPLLEVPPPSLPFVRRRRLGLLDALRALEAAGRDRRVRGVVLRFAGAPHGLAAAATLRRAIGGVRAAGKPVVAYGERFGLGELWVASAATRLWLPPTGSIHVLGLRLETLHVRGLLERLGVAAEVVRAGTHKSAGETLSRHAMSPEHREQLEALVDDLFAELVSALGEGRGIEAERARELLDRGLWSGRRAVEAGLADACLYPDQIEEALGELVPGPPLRSGAPRTPRLVKASAYHSWRGADPGWRPILRDLPRIAYVVAQGVIHSRGVRTGIGVERMRRLLEALRRRSGVRGVVLRLTSPGGDAIAADLLWRSLGVLRRDKPVVVSMGEVAASGGYYAAVAADAVLAEAPSLTGSIGVVSAKLSFERLYERMGIGRQGVERGRHAGLLSDSRGYTAEERALMREEVREVYEVFVDRVAEGRRLPREAVERAAQGRVWSGLRARELGLVDALGGPLEAIAEVRRRAGIGDAERVLLEVHALEPPLAALRLLLGTRAGLR